MHQDCAISADARQQYEAAQAAHYTTKDWHEALQRYRGVMSAHPNSQEAEYSQTQIESIVRKVVPGQELLDVQVELALAHLERPDSPDGAPVPAAPPALEPPG